MVFYSILPNSRKLSILLICLLPAVLSCEKKEITNPEDLKPLNIDISYVSGRPVISWYTSRPASGAIHYGLYSDDYRHFIYESDGHSRDHSIDVFGADSGQYYYFRIYGRSRDGASDVSEEMRFAAQTANQAELLEWTMLNISQDVAIGDCHYIRTPNGFQVMIDSGPDEKTGTIMDFCSDRGINHFDLAVITHLHRDHYGAFISGIFSTYEFDSLKMAESHESRYDNASSNILSSAYLNNIGVNLIEEGETLNWDPDITVTTLHSGSIGDGEENNCSIVLKISYGRIDFILTGDAEVPAEMRILNSYSNYELDSEVLKVGHHGRYDASSSEWIEAVDPIACAIPVDQQSSYGGNSLPSQEVISRIKEYGADIYRSDKNYPDRESYNYGHVIILTDGNTFEISVE